MSVPVVSARLESAAFACDNLQIVALNGREAISELFTFDIELVSTDGRLDPGAAPGALATLVLCHGDEEVRRIHGLIDRRRTLLDGSHSDAPRFRLRLVPRAARLGLVRLQQIFMDLSVPALVAKKLDLVGLGSADTRLRLSDSYAEREFIVQFDETDYEFVCRLTEHLGISFYFEHDDADRIVLSDGVFPPALDEPLSLAEVLAAEREQLLEIECDAALTTSLYAVYDYNYRRPDVFLLESQAIEHGNGGGISEYGAHVKTPEEAAQLARVRAEERDCRREIFRGRSSSLRFSAGHTFSMEASGPFEGEQLLLAEVEHAAVFPALGSEGATSYENRFSAVRAGLRYRPARRTRRPDIPGLMTAVVQGGSDGKTASLAKLDSEGRYTVQFHFDAGMSGATKASRPVRMAQPFGGTQQGMHFPLRPGTEVVVAFTNGDPDRPVILGAVPNAHARSPVTAANAFQNRISVRTGSLIEISEKQ